MTGRLRGEAKNAGRSFTIGIDVGGTNTDAVIYDCAKAVVVSSVKIPTKHSNYEWSVSAALKSLFATPLIRKKDIISINISTTLSTNAILENRGAPVNLVLIGFAGYPRLVREILAAVKPCSLCCARGGHTSWGEEKEPLDAALLADFAKEHRGELFAVSSMYAARNPRHETKAEEIINSEGCLGITCGNDLARSRLNAVKRTLTAYLNSSLIPLTKELIDGIENAAAENSLAAPVMFLRSDSSLVSAGWCRKYPLETIFSGPAASVRGSQVLAGSSGPLVAADMGGTSTDIGAVMDGRAVFSEEGAVIGSYRTMIPSLDITTIALGGDSAVSCSQNALSVGPQRALPLCRACELPSCPRQLFERLLDEVQKSGQKPEFIIVSEASAGTQMPQELVALRTAAARSVFLRSELQLLLAERGLSPEAARRILECGRRHGYITDCMFTPTDAMNIQKLADIGNAEYSRLGGSLLDKIGSGDTAARVITYAKERLASEVAAKSAGLPPALLRVYVGAPAGALVAEHGTDFVVPSQGPVAGAVGAAASSLELSCSVSIVHSFSDEIFAAFLPTETLLSKDFPSLVRQTESKLEQHLLKQASLMGCSHTDVEISQKRYYLGRTESIAALSSAVLEGRASVQSA